VRRHDVLRSRFVGGGADIELVLDLRATPWERRNSAVGAAVGDLVLTPFQLDTEHGVRWALIRLADDEHVFVHAEHHAVHDGWSFHIFVHDLIEGYEDALDHGVVRRPMPEIGYYDFAHWQRRCRQSSQVQRQREFWRSTLAGANTMLELPRKPWRPGGASSAGHRGCRSVVISRDR
jgi:hypothetical protein